jgi:chaperonin cofactor prefoldin
MDDQSRSEDLERQTDGLERQGEKSERELKEHGDKLADEIEDVRKDWERKQDDSAVPGAVGDALTGSEDQPDAGTDEQRLPDGPG